MQDHGVGKTTFALQIADSIAKKGKKVAYISLEMSKEQITQKQLARASRINSRKIRNGDLTTEQFVTLNEIANELNTQPLIVMTNASTIQKIELEARRLKNKKWGYGGYIYG